jgi:fatty acid desaturase
MDSSERNQIWVIPSLTKDFKRNLASRNELRATIDVLLRVSISIFFLAGMLKAESSQDFPLFIVLMLLNGFVSGFYGWAGAGHEYFHSTPFKNRKLNRALFRLFSCITWNNWAWFEVSHWIHHKRTLLVDDPEGPPAQSLRLKSLFWMCTVNLPLFCRRFKVIVLNLFGKVPTANRIILEELSKSNTLRRKLQVGALSVLVVHASILFLFFTKHPYTTLAFIFSTFTFQVVNRVLEICQHFGRSRDTNDYRTNTRTLILGRVLSFLYSNMNYHQEHHMFPAVPYYRLPNLHKQLLESNDIQQPHRGLVEGFRIAATSPNKYATRHFDCLSCSLICPLTPESQNKE